MPADDSSRRAGQRALSARELEVVRLIVDGLSNREIAERLVISARTVQSHLEAAMEKTGTRTRTQLAVAALRAGLVPLMPQESAQSSGPQPGEAPKPSAPEAG